MYITFELCTIKVYDGQCFFDILGLYRQTKANVCEFIDELPSILI